jgi:hypothetical protein
LNRLIEILNPIKDTYFYKDHFEQIIKKLCEFVQITEAKAVIENLPVIDPDRDILMYFHNRSFKGKEKEKAILFELRDRITYPNLSKLKILEEKIKEELWIDELTLSVWHDERVYFDVGFNNSFGFLSLVNLQYTAQQANGYGSLISDQVPQKALDFINDKYTGVNDEASLP